MYSKTSIQYRLGPLSGLWVLHTTVQGQTNTCYFFRMGELFYQAKIGRLNDRRYLCQVEKLPEDVEALELPAPADTAVESVRLEYLASGEAGESALCLQLEDGTCLRFTLDDLDIGTRMAVSREQVPAEHIDSIAVEICGFDTPAIPLPASAARTRRGLMGLGGALLACSLFLPEALLEAAWSFVFLGPASLVLIFAAARMPWSFRCPYCGKAVMRPRGSVYNYVCPHCGNTCHPSGR